MERDREVRLRNIKNGGYCWQQNELFEIFLPLIGPVSLTVYCCMTQMRQDCPLAVNSRKMAETIGASKDTVLRSLAVLEHLGMIVANGKAAHGVAIYQLVDLKALVNKLGTTWDGQARCHRLDETVRNRLIGEIHEVKGRARRATVSHGDKEGQSALLSKNFQGDTSGAQSGDNSGAPLCDNDLPPLIGRLKTEEKSITPLPPCPPAGTVPN